MLKKLFYICTVSSFVISSSSPNILDSATNPILLCTISFSFFSQTMKFSSSLLSVFSVLSLLVSFASADDCGFFKHAQCTAAALQLVDGVTNIPVPPSLETVKDVLEGAQSILEDCQGCFAEFTISAICEATNHLVDVGSKYGIDIEFDVKECKKSGVWDKDIIDIIDGVIGEIPGIGETAETTETTSTVTVSSDGGMAIASNNCADLNVNLGIVEHRGRVCFKTGNKVGVDAKGSFKVFGATVYNYNEFIGEGSDVCFGFKTGVVNVTPCFSLSRNKLKLCVKTKAPWPVGKNDLCAPSISF